MRLTWQNTGCQSTASYILPHSNHLKHKNGWKNLFIIWKQKQKQVSRTWRKSPFPQARTSFLVAKAVRMMGNNSKDFPFTRRSSRTAPTKSLAKSTSNGPGKWWTWKFREKALSRNPTFENFMWNKPTAEVLNDTTSHNRQGEGLQRLGYSMDPLTPSRSTRRFTSAAPQYKHDLSGLYGTGACCKPSSHSCVVGTRSG
jgi:hypothetical protein